MGDGGRGSELHAAMRGTLAGIECVEHLQKEHSERSEESRLEEIELVVVEMGRQRMSTAGGLHLLISPLSTMGAQMSMLYVVAARLVAREVLMAQFDKDKLNRPACVC